MRGVALHHACHAGQIGSVELLLRAGCDIHAENAVGETAADLAAAAGYRDELLVALGQAAAAGEVATPPPRGRRCGAERRRHSHSGGWGGGGVAAAAARARGAWRWRGGGVGGGGGGGHGGADRAHRAAPRAGVCASGSGAPPAGRPVWGLGWGAIDPPAAEAKRLMGARWPRCRSRPWKRPCSARRTKRRWRHAPEKLCSASGSKMRRRRCRHTSASPPAQRLLGHACIA
eukprot:COSAG01_NODE_8418_length_2789_cov_3.000000_2_plen_231_part_00